MAMDLNYDPNWKPAGGIDLSYDPSWKPKESGIIDAIKQGVGDIGLKLNVGTTVAIPEQVVGINDLARKTTALGMLSEAITPEFVKKARGGVEDSTRKALNERRDDLSTEMSPAQQSADKKQYFTDEAAWSNLAKDGITAVPGKVADLAAEGKLFGEGWGDWRKVTGSAAESLPGTVATMGPTFKIAGTAYEQAFAQTLAKTGSEAAAKAAATKAAERSAMLAGGAAEGLQGAGGANESTRRSVMEMPVAKLEQSPFFQEELKANGGDVEAARTKAADVAATMSAGIAFLFDATLGMLGDKYIGSAAAGKGTRAGAVARGTAQEMPTEFVQSGGEKFGENLGVREFADPSQLLMAGVGEEATAGGLAGGLTGGVMGGGLHRNRTQPEVSAAPQQLPDTGPLSRSANVALATQDVVQQASPENTQQPVVSDVDAQYQRLAELDLAAEQRSLTPAEIDEANGLQLAIEQGDGNARESLPESDQQTQGAATQQVTDVTAGATSQEVVVQPAESADPTMAAKTDNQLKNLSGPGHSKNTRQSASAEIARRTAKFAENRANATQVDPMATQAPQANDAKTSPSDDISGEKLTKGWTAFSEDAGSLGIPRAEMPQIKAEHRGAMTQFMNARGISHQQEEVPAESLKPTQAEFSPAKVEKAAKREGGDRSILVSSDNYVLDGHHQWLAKRDSGEPIKIIRLNAPISEAIGAALEFPSSHQAGGATATEKNTPRNGPASRDDLVGAILRVTGGKGVAANMAQTITGDKAGSANAKVRGLFTNDGVADLGDTATLLRTEEGYDVRDGEHLSELIRLQAGGNPVYSMARAEREAAGAAEKQHRDEIRRQAKKLGVKQVARPFSDVEQEVIDLFEQRHTDAVAKLDSRAKSRFDAMLKHAMEVADFDEVDAIITDAQSRYSGRQFFTEAAKQLRGYIDDLTIERQTKEQANASEEEHGTTAEPDWIRSGTEDTGLGSAASAAPEGTQKTTEQPAGRSAEYEEKLAAIQEYGLPESTVFKPGKGLATGKWMAEAGGVSGNMEGSIQEAAASLASSIVAEKNRSNADARRKALSETVALKVKSGEQPTDAELKELFGLQENQSHVKQSAVGSWAVEYLGVPRNGIKSALGEASGNVTSDGGVKYPIVYPRKLHKVFGAGNEGLTLTGETNEEAATNFARQQGEPELTKEQIDREAEAFGLAQEIQPKTQGVQTGLFTADGRVATDATANSEKAAEAKSTKLIEDFGEKLGGAKKDRMPSMDVALSDDEIATQPLSKIWPASEIDAIDDPFIAAVASAARAEIPAKPRVSYKVARWVEKVKTVRNLAQRILDGSITKDRFSAVMKSMRGLDGFAAKVSLLEAIDRKHWSRIGDVREYPDAYRYGENNERIPAPSVLIDIDGKHKRFDGAKSVADIIEQMPEVFGDAAPDKKMQFEVRGRGESFSINKKGDREYRKLKTFTNTKEAFAFIKDHHDELLSAWEAVKQSDNVKETDVRNQENRPRTAQDWRQGKDVTPDQFAETFGFRGVEWGNWVSQGKNDKERQGMLNQAFDAMMDLADIVGIPPKAISLNGSLGLGFGSRGSGWASAHFEPSNLVINLTKTRGAGTFAHEWFHALDNYFSRQRGGEVKIERGLGAQESYRAKNYITYRPEPMYVHKSGRSAPMTKAQLERNRKENPSSGYFKAENWQLDPDHPQGVRPEVERAFAELVEALDASPMLARARKNDKGRDDYWSRIIERGARSFENYVISKMMEKGYNNDYLANVREVQDFPRAKERYPYLLPEEVAPIAEAFDNLFSTVQTKETERGVAMFSRQSLFYPDDYDAKSFAKSVESIDETGVVPRNDLTIGDTPKVFKVLGANSRTMVMPASVVKKATDPALRGHDVRIEDLKNLPALLADPVMVFDSQTEVGALVAMVEAKDKSGNPVIVAVHVDAKGTGFHSVNKVASVYGKEGTSEIQRWINSSLRYYNKQKAPGWLHAVGLQLPEANTIKRLNPSVVTDTDIVNQANLARAEYGDGIPMEDLNAVASGFRTEFPGIPVMTVEDESQLPKDLRDEIAAADAVGDVAGAYHEGQIYLIKGGIRDIEHAQHTVVHEGVHGGLKRIGVPDEVLLDISKSNPKIRNEAYRIQAKYHYSYVRSVEEAMADFGQSARSLKGWEKLQAWMRGKLRKLGVVTEWTDSDVDYLLTKALKSLKTPAATTFYRGTAFAPAWHGSPHDHDRFDMGKVGTGEGAQAYGYGLYFAGSKAVAEYYRKGLSQKDFINKAREAYSEFDDPNDAADALIEDGGLSDAQKELVSALREDDWLGFDYPHQAVQAAFRDPENFDMSERTKDAIAAQGRLYQVELAPKEDEYLDWDKPLTGQSEMVRDSLGRVGIPDAQMSGQEIYAFIRNREADNANEGSSKQYYKEVRWAKSASDYLHSIGIRGIRYLDGSSRSAGEGNHNYVIFNDADVSITAKFNRASGGKISPADKAIYGMAAEGKSTDEVLKFIASASHSIFNRQVAKVLLKTGIAPDITVGDAKGWKFNTGEGKYAAAYNPKTDTVALFRPASAERNMVHELIHAATLKALEKNGVHSQNMKALYAFVKRSGKLKGMYGMADVDEFVAESFSNPKFQSALREIDAPRLGNSPVKNAWAWFIRNVRSILGLKIDSHDALSQALDIGLGVMRENMRLSGDAGGAVRHNVINDQWTAGKAKFSDLTSPESINTLVYNFQNKYVDLKNLQDRIKQIGGTLTDMNDAYLGEEMYHGKVMKKTADFLDAELRPMLQQLFNNGIKKEDFENFLHARHAPEANKALADRNPTQAMIDAGKQGAETSLKDLRVQLQKAQAQGAATKSIEQAIEKAQAEKAKWSGAQAFQGTEAERLSLSGMSDAEAAQVMAAIPAGKRNAMDSAAAKVDAIQAKTLAELEKYGLMDKASLDAWRNEYQHYIPLHRDEAHPDSTSHPIGQGFSVKGDAAKRRTGSNEKVTNILGHIAMQREAAITRGEKNSVSKRLWLQASQNPDKDFWAVDRPPMLKTIDQRTGFVRSQVDPMYKNKPNVLMVRIAGRDAAIVFNEHNPEAVRLAEALKNLDGQDLDIVERTIGSATRWFAAVNTQYNPIFGIINLLRDGQSGILNLTSTALGDKKGEVAKQIPTALKAIYQVERGGQPGNAAMAALWQEFQSIGGQTGYRDLYASPEDRVKALDKELKALERGNLSKRLHAVADWLSDYNTVMENGVRLAAYKVAIDQGMSKERAASLAKNLTVNFNRKGAKAAKLGAFYAFFNASVQGTERLAKTMTGPAGRKIMMAGIALGVLQQIGGMIAMAGDDGDDEWDKIPDFVKERSLIIPIGWGYFISIPMPLGFHVLPNIGRLFTEWALGGNDKPTGKQIGKLMNVVIGSFNPLGGSDAVDMVSPTVADPVIALLRNKDWTGKPIYREDMASLDPTPGFTRTKDSATPWSKGVSYVINWASGGTDYQPGAWSPTPDQIDYVIGQITGGVGREAGKLAQTVAAVTGLSNDELPVHKVPLIGRLVGSTNGPSGQSEKFYENIRELNGIEREIKGRFKDGKDIDTYLDAEPKVSFSEDDCTSS